MIDDRRERRVLALLDKAERLRVRRLGAALRTQEEAIALIRQLAAERSGQARDRQALASALYTAASLHTQSGNPRAAIAACDEAEELYRGLGLPNERALIADIVLRRATALAAEGRGASAVAEADQAVVAYEELGPALQRDLARVYAMNAGILAHHGDPDMAVGSADRGIRIFSRSRTPLGQFQIGEGETPYLMLAGAISATIHARFGRIEVALAAADFGLQFAHRPRALRTLREVHRQVDAFSQQSRRDLGDAIARSSRTARAPASALETDLLGVLAELARMPTLLGFPDLTLAAGDDLPLTTLAEALAADGDRVGRGGLADAITRPALDTVIATPSHRGDPPLAPFRAQRLARAALRVLPRSQAAGIRLGLEAHQLYALASRAQVQGMRYRLGEFGPDWARVLLALTDAFERRGNLPMALDRRGRARRARPRHPLAAGDVDASERRPSTVGGRLPAEAGDGPQGTDEAAVQQVEVLRDGQDSLRTSAQGRAVMHRWELGARRGAVQNSRVSAGQRIVGTPTGFEPAPPA